MVENCPVFKPEKPEEEVVVVVVEEDDPAAEIFDTVVAPMMETKSVMKGVILTAIGIAVGIMIGYSMNK